MEETEDIFFIRVSVFVRVRKSSMRRPHRQVLGKVHVHRREPGGEVVGTLYFHKI